MKYSIHFLRISTWFCLFGSINSIPLPTPSAVVAHVWHPSLFFAFPVNSTELQKYIDSRLVIYEPFGNGTGYILFSLSNTIVPGESGFADAEISTPITYKGAVYKSSFHLHFASLVPALSGSAFAPMPYGYSYTPHMNSTTNEGTYTYHFFINDNQVQLNTSITWNPNETINVNTIPSSNLASILLNERVNSEFIQSVYKTGTPLTPILPLLHGRQLNYTYNEPLHPCTINTFTSTYFQKTVGPISFLQDAPVFCIFTLERSANVTSTVQIDVNV